MSLDQRIQALRLKLRLYPGTPDFFGREGSFDPPVGSNWEPDGPPHGYYIDFTMKAQEPAWPPFWLRPGETAFHVATAQWGLGAYERYLDGDGEIWLEGARKCADHLIEIQRDGGPLDGGLFHAFPMLHTFPLEPGWMSAMAQGEVASLLVRVHQATGEERYADAARRAVKAMLVPVSEGGTLAEKDGLPFVEEYPTAAPSCVLNGAIFALWGLRDVGVGLGDAEALAWFEKLTAALAELMPRYDLGYWSTYDLYPHPLPNVASGAYHLLHIRQLIGLHRLHPDPRFERAIEHFDRYRDSALDRRRAFLAKVMFRLRVPRNQRLSKLYGKGGGEGEVLVLCYHAVSETWPADLAVTPAALERQLRQLVERGFKPVTFSEAVNWSGPEKVVAITFDDGYRSVLSLGLPILEAVGTPATLFVPTDYIGVDAPMVWPGIDQWMGGDHQPELLPMSWQEVGKLGAAGWEIGSHTRSHPHLSQIDRARLPDELAGSKEVCENALAQPCTTIAYPYGDYDETVEEATMAAGYETAAALPDEISGSAKSDPYAFPRVGIYRGDSDRVFRLKTSKLTRMVRQSPAWPLLASAVRGVRARIPK